MELDYANILNAGQSLQGDLQQQMFLNDQRKAQTQARQLQMAALQQKQEREAAFRAAAQVAAQSADPKAIGDLMVQFPEFADQIKPAWQALSDQAMKRNLTQSGTIFVRAKNGDAKGAAALLRQRYEADMAAGQADPSDKELIDALESGDPAKVQQATATIGFSIAALDPSKFSETYGKLFPADAKSTFSKEYEDRVRLFGKKAADAWVKVQDAKVFSVNPGGSLQSLSADTVGNPQTAEGGDQSTGMGGVTAPALGANGLPATLTPEQYRVTSDALGKAKTDAWMKENGITIEWPQGSAPVRVRSVQEAMKLKPGTHYVTPDGEEYVR